VELLKFTLSYCLFNSWINSYYNSGYSHVSNTKYCVKINIIDFVADILLHMIYQASVSE